MIQVKIATKRTHFPGLRVALPIGAPFCVLRGGIYCDKRGRVHTTQHTYVWIDNLEQVRNSPQFTVHMCRHGQGLPFTVQVDGRQGWARILREFALGLSADHVIRPRVLNSDARTGAPHDRVIGAFLMRGRPNYDTNPNVITDYSVTDNVRIGCRILSQEAYNTLRLGLPAVTLN